MADSSTASLQSTISSVSTLSEVSVMSEGSACDVDGRPGSSLQVGDNASEVDGSESGTRAGNDGNDSDSSSYSSVSTRGMYGRLSAAVERRQGPYTVEGREIAPEAMGQFPSLQEVLQAASEEQQQLELEQEREGMSEPRSRRDSFSSRYDCFIIRLQCCELPLLSSPTNPPTPTEYRAVQFNISFGKRVYKSITSS